MRLTKASTELAKRFGERGRQRDCSKATGISQSRLSRFARGELFPRADEGAALQSSDGILIDWWSEEPDDPSDAQVSV